MASARATISRWSRMCKWSLGKMFFAAGVAAYRAVSNCCLTPVSQSGIRDASASNRFIQ